MQREWQAALHSAPPVDWPVCGRQVLLSCGGRAHRAEGAAKAAAPVQQPHGIQARRHLAVSATTHTTARQGCTQQGHGWLRTVATATRATQVGARCTAAHQPPTNEHDNTPQPGTYAPATMHPNFYVPEEVLALHDFVWCERLLGSHEDKHLDAERLARRAGARQVSQVVLNELLQLE